ncbi:hypothetical protein NYZ99_11065 [Maribacter litopenaei]|uniref:Sensor of ECF-type sigma factor n=1 Tax=Maribacter litopenaei TaxID=2976127 RepID=A0ABY5Y3X6_9FLAO|nr:hypothetical protein [Maribacter litopenaei]UWX53697.1 hypothetical protein NYZ99_11065 [Maribacter litopenaei]
MNRIVLTLFLLFALMSFGQDKSKEKIKALKVAFLTEQLELTSKEAQEFWPVYNEYEEKRHELRKKQWVEIRSKLKELNGISEAESQKLLKAYMDIEEEEEKLDNAFLREVSKVISAKKTLILMRSEEDFKRQLIKQYRHNKGGR